MFNFRALEIIRDLNTSESRRSKFTEMALQKILDSHLSAKYSYLGYLGSTDLFMILDYIIRLFIFFQANNNTTSDGFYDMGPIREGGKFLTIEELAAEDVNDRRPVLILYAPEKR